MKNSPFSIVGTLGLFCCLVAMPAFAQVATQATALSPEDLDAKKYVFASKAPAGSVVVFRRQQYENDRLMGTFETISNTPLTEKLVFIDWTMIRENTIYSLKTNMAAWEIPKGVRLKSIEYDAKPAKVKIVFENDNKDESKTLTYVFTMVNERYAAVKKRIPGLPDRGSHGWTIAYGYKPQWQ